MQPRWTSSVKDAVGTAYSASSRVWFTCSHGILNEIYHPTIDHAQIRDMEFLITDGETFAHEEKRDLLSSVRVHPSRGAGSAVHQPRPRWPLHADQGDHLRPAPQRAADPRPAGGATRLLPRLKVYALLAPHLDGGGAGNSARAMDVAGYRMLLAWKNSWSLAMGASCGFSRVSCGFVGASDGWRDLKENLNMEWEFGSATNGNLAVTGELNLDCARNRAPMAPRASLQWPSASARRSTRPCRRR